MLYNLLDNAVKYNPPGGTVRLTLRDDGDGTVLSVADTGIGIPPEARERVFERFYRVDKSRSKEVGGTGLGLSIVKHAAAVLGAAVSLESTLGEGTTVTVRLPHHTPSQAEQGWAEPSDNADRRYRRYIQGL